MKNLNPCLKSQLIQGLYRVYIGFIDPRRDLRVLGL